MPATLIIEPAPNQVATSVVVHNHIVIFLPETIKSAAESDFFNVYTPMAIITSR